MNTTDYEALAREHGLERVGARPPLGEYLMEAWRRRNFAIALAKYRIQASLHDSRLGMSWIVLFPILQAALYGTIFGVIMPSDTRPDNFVPFLVVGVFTFGFFSSSLSGGAKAVTGNVGLVRSLSFPRILLPLAQVIQFAMELVPMVIVMAIIVAAFGEPISWKWLLVVPIYALMALFNAGIALVVARLTVHLKDVTQILPLVTRLFFYVSGIFYSLELVLADNPPWMLTLAQLNPVHDYIALVRYCLVGGTELQTLAWVVAVASAIVTAAFGIVFFWKAEERYGSE
ncbi:ABC transporter permease [Demequina salsinemoris]|uniref:ABC transporter permease n=1 Tax=Demequina salsinemoris TaxID=577470 RepID=UPI000783500B|nr:ABC transporter permease [Demequina salsinemoris]